MDLGSMGIKDDAGSNVDDFVDLWRPQWFGNRNEWPGDKDVMYVNLIDSFAHRFHCNKEKFGFCPP